MKSFKIALSCMLVGLFFTACQNDNNIPLNQVSVEEESQFSENFGDSFNARFIGTVVNESNDPISGVSILVGNSTAITDANGVFTIEQATVYEKFAFIKATKAGYIDGSRALVPSSVVNQLKIMLLKMDVIATINANEQSTVNLANGTEIVFDGSFVNLQGSSYSGAVSVVLKHLSPDDENINAMMPGMLFAENENGDPRVLETYGMIAVELRGTNDEELQLATGNLAQISVPLPATITNAPATIPLWYFDEANGYWKEEGQATLQGNMYVGEVSHFSFWNYDAQFPAIYLCINLVDSQGQPIDTYVTLTHSNNDFLYPTTGGYSYEGQVCGLVPQDEELMLNIPNHGCIGNNFNSTIGPFSMDENITITVEGNSSTTFMGTFNDCSGNPITNGYMQLFYNDQSHIIPITNGMINQVIEFCASSTAYSSQVIDLNANQTTDVVTGNFVSPTTDLGTEMSCVDLADSDNDGVLDIDEDLNGDNNLDNDDTDQDGTPNYLDEDDDGDGVNTIDEDRNNDGNPTNDDSDGDQILDYLDDQDVAVYASEIFANTNSCDSNALEYDLTQWYTDTVNTYEYFETATDTIADTNPIANPIQFITASTTQMAFVKGTNTISNQSDYETIYLLGIQYLDSDQDGLSDCEETTGLDEDQTGCSPNGNITDPNDADSDGDGFNDCVEANEGTDPNDINDFPTTPAFNCCNNDTLSSMDVNTITNPQDDVEFFALITPNNDGFNDGFQINNISTYPSNSLSIYNDQDVLVYEITGYGTTNNNIFIGVNSFDNTILPDGTYRYQLTFADTVGQQNTRNAYLCIVTQFYPNGTFSGNCYDTFDPIIG